MSPALKPPSTDASEACKNMQPPASDQCKNAANQAGANQGGGGGGQPQPGGDDGGKSSESGEGDSEDQTAPSTQPTTNVYRGYY